MMFLLYFSDIIKNMLAKSSKKMYFDAHFHLFFSSEADFCGCTCAHSIEEWTKQQKVTEYNKKIKLAYGIHPQAVGSIDLETNLNFLEELAANRMLSAIGETGFDFFTEDFKKHASLQETVFKNQIDIAKKYNLPVVIHCRKANDKIFEYSGELKKLPSVLFHSFMGTPIEAKSLINRGINAYFSFGKQLLNNNKKVIACVTELPLNVLLCETDAPYQTLKGEKETFPQEIEKVYKAMISIRENKNEEEFMNQMALNFQKMFNQ